MQDRYIIWLHNVYVSFTNALFATLNTLFTVPTNLCEKFE